MTTPAQTLAAGQLIRDAAKHGTRFGDRKVFLCTIPGIDLADAECVAWLEGLRRSGLVQFARADLVAAMDPALVKASEWVTRDRLVPTFSTTDHFLVLPEHLIG